MDQWSYSIRGISTRLITPMYHVCEEQAECNPVYNQNVTYLGIQKIEKKSLYVNNLFCKMKVIVYIPSNNFCIFN